MRGFDAYLARQRAKAQGKKDAIGDMSQGGIVKQADSERWAFVLPDMTEPGQWRIQYFDTRGFSGHGIYASAEAALDSAIASGFEVRDDQALDRVQTLASFWRGIHAAELIRRINCKQLTHAQGDALMAEYDEQQAAADTQKEP
jgi:hypothetical protein